MIDMVADISKFKMGMATLPQYCHVAFNISYVIAQFLLMTDKHKPHPITFKFNKFHKLGYTVYKLDWKTLTMITYEKKIKRKRINKRWENNNVFRRIYSGTERLPDRKGSG